MCEKDTERQYFVVITDIFPVVLANKSLYFGYTKLQGHFFIFAAISKRLKSNIQ